VRGDAAALVEHAKAGITVAPDDADALADAALILANMPVPERAAMGHNGRTYYDTHLSFKVGVDKMVEALEAAACTKR
jgi:colanic acid biosynthesis glycosyl transferase WcaI